LQVHSPPGVAWPPMVTLSLGYLGFGVGDAAVAPHCLVVDVASTSLTQRMASCGQPCRPPGLWVYALVCLPAGRYLSARRSRMRACRMWCQQNCTCQPGLHFRGLGLVRALGVLRLGRRSWLWHLSSCAVDCAFPAYNLVVAIVGRRACVVGVWRDSSLHLALQPAYAGLAGFERGAGS
jgi:hypothetical protein